MKIIIKRCTAFGPQFENLQPGSIHEVLEKTERGWWVMGVREKVLVLYSEAKEFYEVG